VTANKIMPAYEELVSWYTAKVEASVEAEHLRGVSDQTGNAVGSAKRQEVCRLINEALRPNSCPR